MTYLYTANDDVEVEDSDSVELSMGEEGVVLEAYDGLQQQVASAFLPWNSAVALAKMILESRAATEVNG